MVARLEATRMLLAFTSCMNFILFEMDVKCAFVNEYIVEEVYAEGSLGFENKDFPNHVYKLIITFYGLKQDSRPCYVKLVKSSLRMAWVWES